VTPTLISTSRICLLFTSSSRARSLIRIFIRRSFPYAGTDSTCPYRCGCAVALYLWRGLR
jgi:hypothetical protein